MNPVVEDDGLTGARHDIDESERPLRIAVNSEDNLDLAPGTAEASALRPRRTVNEWIVTGPLPALYP